MTEGIAYQNKDIEFKLLSETYKNRSFEAYGLNLPRIKAVLPTNLPAVSVNEKRIDNLFLLEDDTLAIVDYESENKVANRIKYVNYIGRVMERYYQKERKIPDIRMIVIYTGDVIHAEPVFEIKCMSLRMEQVFVRDLPAEEIYQTVTAKLDNGEELTEQELMRLIILPLAEKGNNAKQKRIKQVIELSKKIEDNQQVFVLSGLLVASDKFINRAYAEDIRRCLSMTKVFQIFEEEKQEAVKEAEREKDRKYTEVLKEKDRKYVLGLLRKNMDIDDIMDITELPREEIEQIQQDMLVSK